MRRAPPTSSHPDRSAERVHVLADVEAPTRGERTGGVRGGWGADRDADTDAGADAGTHADTATDGSTGTGKCAICAECRSQPI